ncbi:MAG: hypothetical protein JF616_03705 [Fibrobacteres bacterium]|jgi:hypothetical protein|nr:hypothetical protein [Fibrobacterota bacterium]
MRILIFLAAIAVSAASATESVSASDRFGGPINAGDVFPTTMEPLHPLNPADLARTTETTVQFGIQEDGRSLILGLPNFQLAISGQTLDWTDPSGVSDSYDAKKYEIGYGLSTVDLGLTAEGAASAALGFNLRYLDYLSRTRADAQKTEKAYADVGLSGAFRRFRADFACLNLARLAGNANGTQPGNDPREYNFGLAYGLPSDWMATARLGFQDTAKGQSIVDVGFEKLFFRSVTFRIGSQRRYALGDGAATEVKSSLSGGIWYRVNFLGEGYRYPEKDGDLFSLPTFVRMLRDIEVGGLVTLTKTPEATDNPSQSNTSLLMTVGKSF